METHSVPRVIVIALSVLLYITALVFNALAAQGITPFRNTIANVSKTYETDLTPAGWTFSIWGLIYTWLTGMVLYIMSLVCRKGDWSLALLPYGFYICWISNMVMNIAWLVLWDREMMYGCLVVLALVALTNYSMVFFCSSAMNMYGAWLSQEHPKDLFFLRLLVQNGLALYSTWTSIATLINLAIVLNLEQVAKNTAGTVSLCALLGLLLGWFILENFVIERSVRYILTIYPVVIFALLGNLTKHYDPANPTPNAILMLVLQVLACILYVVRIGLVIWRCKKQPLFTQGSANKLVMSPMSSPSLQ